MKLYDFHTHRVDNLSAIISLPPAGVEQFLHRHPEARVSTGIHPWDTDGLEYTPDIERIAALPGVVAIGETGLDKLRGAPLDRQIEIMRRHIALSERLGKSLVIHCVKAWDELLSLKREMCPRQNWGIHGFRGGAQQARQLLDHGLYLSLGEHFNEAAAAVIPDDRLLVETDESCLPVGTIAARIAAARRGSAPDPDTLACFLGCGVE